MEGTIVSTQDKRRPSRHAARQRGQAMLLTVLLMATGVAGVIYTLATPARLSIASDKGTAAALAGVRDALIGWSAARIPTILLPNARPGELPCPDMNNDGFEDGACVAGAIGRVPWKTLGIPEPKDGSGETLWYAISGVFRIWNMSAVPLNSDTAGELTITGTTPASNVIAIIFAPGPLLGAQVRDAANLNNVASYLEGDNANGDATYTTALASATFNDKLLPITSDALFSVVNVRVAKEAIAALEAYRTAHDEYPFANPYGSASPYNCVTDLIRGRFPGRPEGCGGAAWGAALPGWFLTNNWNLVTHYAISKACSGSNNAVFALVDVLLAGLLPPGLAKRLAGESLCGLADNLTRGNLIAVNNQLTKLGVPILSFAANDYLFVTGVTGADGARTLVIVTGRAQVAPPQIHPCASVGQCLEDPANTDGDATYVKPSRFPTSNDRMAVACDPLAPCPRVP
jgi:hypothetical protein